MAQLLLLDTHTLVWALAEPNRLSRRARQALSEGELVLSVASLWELILKRDKPGALLADPVLWWQNYVPLTALPVLAIRQRHVIQLTNLPHHHKDPFDRILLAQAMVESAAIVSKDQSLKPYGVPLIW
jgi:PIN domain nuclease of toxin-antitoxin system